MKKLGKARVLVIVFLAMMATIVLPGCAGMGVGISGGVSYHSGPYGGGFTPSLNIGIGGGGWYW